MNCAGLVLALATLSCNSSPPPPAPREQPPTVPVVVAEPRPPNPRPSKELRDALALDGPDAPTAVDPREETRLVAHSFTELQVYRVANGKLTLEARTPIEKFWTVRSWAWANANELVVLLGNGVGKPDYQLVWFRDGAFKPLAAPAAIDCSRLRAARCGGTTVEPARSASRIAASSTCRCACSPKHPPPLIPRRSAHRARRWSRRRRARASI